MIKPFLNQVTHDKISVYGFDKAEWTAALLQDIDADQLPAFYGGTMVDPDGNTKCPSKVNTQLSIPIFYSSSILASLIGVYLVMHGDRASAGVSFGISEGISHIDSSIGIIKDIAEKLRTKDWKLSGMLSALSNSFNKGKSKLEGIGLNIADTIKGSFAPDYSLNYAKL